MMAADSVDAAVDFAPDDSPASIPVDENAGDEWSFADLPTCDLPPVELVDPAGEFDPTVIDDSCLMVGNWSPLAFEPTIIDDSCLLIDNWSPLALEPTDGDVQFVSSEEPDGVSYRMFVCGGGLELPEESSGPWATEFMDPADSEIDWSIEESSDGSFPDWSWDSEWGDGGEDVIDAPSSWDETVLFYAADGSGDDASVRPLFYARGGGFADAEGLEFAAFSTRADGVPAPAVQEQEAPIAAKPRSVAFADMGTMAAAAIAAQSSGSVTETVPVGGRRRR